MPCISISDDVHLKGFLESPLDPDIIPHANHNSSLIICFDSSPLPADIDLYTSESIYVSQHRYTLGILKYVGLLGAKQARSPMSKGIKFNTKGSTLLTDPKKRRRLIGRLQFLI